MKKRWIAGLLCVLLLFQLGAPVRAAGSVYFVAAEESVLPLTDATMPFWSGGYLYVAASVFTNLGISVINNTAKGMTVLEKDRRALLFEWKKGSAQDSSGNIYTPGTIQSGGVTFVPASMVASFFGLQYSVTEVANGHLVWLRAPDFGMEAPTVGARIHLCIEASQTAGNLLDALDRAKGWATFYCTPDYLEANGALLRRMTASGHTVGILVDGTAGEPLEEQLHRGNDALYRATFTKTRLVYLRNPEEGAIQALEQVGWRCLSPSLDRSGYRLEGSSNAASLLNRITARRGDVSVWLGAAVSASGLREFVTSAQKEGHYCRALTETG